MNYIEHELRIAKEYSRLARDAGKRTDVAAHFNNHEAYRDVCTSCKAVECDDKDILCGLVAKHQKKADETSAARIIASDKYKQKLKVELESTGKLPFEEQYSYIDTPLLTSTNSAQPNPQLTTSTQLCLL